MFTLSTMSVIYAYTLYCIHTYTRVEYATVEKVVQESCYEIAFEDGSVCSSLPASQIINVRETVSLWYVVHELIHLSLSLSLPSCGRLEAK